MRPEIPSSAPGALELIDYALPAELIAQEPSAKRDESRLLIVDRQTGELSHHTFAEIDRFLVRGDLLVVNDTRVIPARLRARGLGGGATEILLLEPSPSSENAWRALLRPGKRGRKGSVLQIERDDRVRATVLGREGSIFTIVFEREGGEDHELDPSRVAELCEQVGETPLPPYIHRAPEDRASREDRERYQTVWARHPGAVAAPTAGLHFTPDLLARLESRGVERVPVTLHVGLDTFRPLCEEELRTGRLHGERADVSEASARAILAARREGRRIVAVGTTVVRTLESFARSGTPVPYRDRTDLFIRPGHEFQLVDALVTNFHLPRSSLLLLVTAFADRELILRAYREAVERRYRFFSYGDAMLVV